MADEMRPAGHIWSADLREDVRTAAIVVDTPATAAACAHARRRGWRCTTNLRADRRFVDIRRRPAAVSSGPPVAGTPASAGPYCAVSRPGRTGQARARKTDDHAGQARLTRARRSARRSP